MFADLETSMFPVFVRCCGALSLWDQIVAHGGERYGPDLGDNELRFTGLTSGAPTYLCVRRAWDFDSPRWSQLDLYRRFGRVKSPNEIAVALQGPEFSAIHVHFDELRAGWMGIPTRDDGVSDIAISLIRRKGQKNWP